MVIHGITRPFLHMVPPAPPNPSWWHQLARLPTISHSRRRLQILATKAASVLIPKMQIPSTRMESLRSFGLPLCLLELLASLSNGSSTLADKLFSSHPALPLKFHSLIINGQIPPKPLLENFSSPKAGTIMMVHSVTGSTAHPYPQRDLKPSVGKIC